MEQVKNDFRTILIGSNGRSGFFGFYIYSVNGESV